MEEKLKILDRNQKYEKVYALIPYFVHLGTFIVMSLRRNVYVWLGCTKTQSSKIGVVLHWQPPDVHIFHTDPSLEITNFRKWNKFIKSNV